MSRWINIAIALVLAILWIRHPWLRPTHWGRGFIDRYGLAIGIISAVILGAYFLYLVPDWWQPNRMRKGDHEGMGLGCSQVAAIIVGILWLLLMVGLIFRIEFLTWIISVITLVPAFMIVGGLIHEKIKSLKKRD